MRLVLAGGGTGGHLFPGITIAQEALKEGPSTEVLFIGAPGGLDSTIVPKHNFKLKLIPIGGLKSVGIWQLIKTLFFLPYAIIKSALYLKKFHPDAVVGLGGYSAGPVVLAAKLLKLKTGILENNSVPGFTNRKLAKFVDHIYLAFEEAKKFFPENKIIMTGNPVRLEIQPTPLPPKDRFTIGILGGSQGARRLNQIVVEALPLIDPEVEIIHQTGSQDIEWVKQGYREAGRPGEVEPFFSDMSDFYRKISLSICRAGATTISELAAAKRPGIFIPFPFATDDHQTGNAKSIEALGGGKVVLQSDLTPQKLASIVGNFKRENSELEKMAQKIFAWHKPNAAAEILQSLK
ncbi:undecaprenyldiphospho-muramoylpentapeptide beta-N-acetylglucosaminyltransferase [Bdellovibrionota bacterium]